MVSVAVAIVVASAIWGKHWRGLTVKCVCDNAAVVAIINSGRSKDKLAMHLLRCLFFFAAEFNFFLFAQHLPGKYNVAADALSMNNVSLFFQQVPQAKKYPSTLPPELVLGVGSTAARLDISYLEKLIQFYFAKGIAPSTQQYIKSVSVSSSQSLNIGRNARPICGGGVSSIAARYAEYQTGRGRKRWGCEAAVTNYTGVIEETVGGVVEQERRA